MRLLHYALCLLIFIFANGCGTPYVMKRKAPGIVQSAEAQMAAAPAMPSSAKVHPDAFDLAKLAEDPAVSMRGGGGQGGSTAPETVKKNKAAQRKVIYSGTLTLRVANKLTGRAELDKIIKKYDGLIVNATLDEVTFRVDPERFEAAMNDAAQVGEVAGREIKSEDVTAQYFDLGLRIEVAEGSRKRLMELLGKSGAIKDVLEVERDLRRLTEEIEQLKGALRKMQDQIDLATVRVTLEEKQLVAQPRRYALASVFAWMNQVGLDSILEPISSDAHLDGEFSLHRLFFGPRFQLATGSQELLPEGFLPVLYTGWKLTGVTPQDDRLRVQLLELRQQGDLAFWTDALAEEFRSQRGYIVKAPEAFKMTDPRLRAVALRCETAVGGAPWAYDAWLIQSPEEPKKLIVVEYARVKKSPDEKLATVEQAVRGLKGL